VDYPKDPALPTPFPPGSPEKILVLEARALVRLPLFMKGDAQGARRLEALRVGLCHGRGHGMTIKRRSGSDLAKDAGEKKMWKIFHTLILMRVKPANFSSIILLSL
jgi:hypothetical protein